MASIRQYLLSVIAAAIICSIIRSFLGGKGGTAALIRFLSGAFLIVAVIAPISQIEVHDRMANSNILMQKSDQFVQEGKDAARSEMEALIKAKTETYILEKAADLNMDIAVNVELSGDEVPVPTAVRLTGAVSPYAKKILSTYLSTELAIVEEKQIWS